MGLSGWVPPARITARFLVLLTRLCDLLSALSLRVACCLEGAEILEANGHDHMPRQPAALPHSGTTQGASRIAFPYYDELYLAVLDHNLIDADDILEKLDETAKKKVKRAYTFRLDQERECLDGTDISHGFACGDILGLSRMFTPLQCA